MRTALVGLLLFVASAAAQEGFPLDGTWRGETTNKDGSHRTIVLILQWDGKQISGTLNPGPDGTEFSGASLDPDGWKFAMSFKTAQGTDVRFDGVISDLGKYHRAVAGKWTEGATTFDIRFVRE